MKPVQPLVLKHSSLRCNPADGCTRHYFEHMIILLHCCFIKTTLHQLPIFEPNEFFWANHWDGKEPKWLAYARAIREIIAEVADLKLSDSSV